MVTLKINECIFKRPAKEGQLIKIYGKVGQFGKTSVTLYMETLDLTMFIQENKKQFYQLILFLSGLMNMEMQFQFLVK